MEHGFASCHPAVNFIFFAGAILFGMFFVHPLFLVISLGASVGYYLLLKRRRGLWPLAGTAVLFAVVALFNPIFNARGDTVLFRWLENRPFTLEALLYGCATAGMCVTVLLWFACYNKVMTNDKFTYLFGRFIPAVSLMLCMVLRFVPSLQKKAAAVADVRRCIGKAPECGSVGERLNSGMTILSALTTWALEGAAGTADTMRSRGYGCGERSAFSVYRYTGRDIALGILLLSCVADIFLCALAGGMDVVYLPQLQLLQSGTATICGAVGYGIFLMVPIGLELWEEITWRVLQSKT